MERLGRRLGTAQRRAQLPQRRKGTGLERAAGHAAAAHARSPHHTGADRGKDGRRDRLRRRRDGGRRVHRPGSPARDHCRDRAAGSARRVHLLRPAQLQRGAEPEGRSPHRRRPALPVHDASDVRRDHVRPARPVGQGCRDALHARVFRARQEPAEPGRCRDALRAALREQHRGGQE